MDRNRIGSNRMKAKKCMQWLCVGLLPLLLAACGSKDDAGKSAKSGEAAASKDPVKLVFYSTAGWTQEAFNERFGDTMRKKFPQYTIEYIVSGKGTTFQDLLSAGTPIDVYWQAVDNTIPHLLENGLQFDMSELVKKHGVDLGRLEPSSVSAIRTMSGGKLYALPLVNNTAAFYYNKDLFDKFGVPYPKDGIGWDEVIELGKRLRRTDGGQEYYGIGSHFQPHANLSPLSVPYVDPKTEKPTILSDDKWKTVYNQLISIKKTTDNKNMDANNFVKDRNLAMLDALANLFLNFDLTSLGWDMVAYPGYKEAPGTGPQPLPTLFGITSTSKHKDEAMEVLKYMVSEEVQRSFSERAIIPVLQGDDILKSFGKNSKYKDKNFQAIISKKFAPITPKEKYEAKAREIYSKPLSSLVEGNSDLNTAFRQIDEEMNKMIAAEKAK